MRMRVRVRVKVKVRKRGCGSGNGNDGEETRVRQERVLAFWNLHHIQPLSLESRKQIMLLCISVEKPQVLLPPLMCQQQ
jgi:hypothetical protein